MKDPKRIYERKASRYERLYKHLKKYTNIISNLRLVAAIGVIINVVFVFTTNINYFAVVIAILSIAFFIYLIRIHTKLNGRNKEFESLKNLNLDSIKRLNGQWVDFEDDGEEFQNQNHKYSYDIDIFGQGSLFQWINIAKTQLGRLQLATFLSETVFDIRDIESRQESIKELSTKLWWRQKLHMECSFIGNKKSREGELINWSKTENETYSKNYIVLITRFMPAMTMILLVLAFGLRYVSTYIPIVLFFIQAAFIFTGISKRSKELDIVYRHKSSLQGYIKVLYHIEKGVFDSAYLNKLQDKIKDNNGISTIKSLRELESIVDRILNRNNAFFLPINILLLWDYRCLIDLEKWKKKHGPLIEVLLRVIGEMEALSSLATIGYDNPNWATPSITTKASTFYGKSIGHPLLTNKRVNNDIKMEEPSRILLITGSNMSGKSTFLRTIGINLVLAYAGASVCADYMRCSIMDIYTCMRTSDNLEKGISSFYGELLRIKTIVEATKGNRQVFFLLDEIFKGTNSHDRHQGAKHLVKQLYKNNAMGLVSTHDLELGDLEKESRGEIKNYHFQESYKDDKIIFDYKLRSGVSTTRNAMYLIKMAGVEIEDI